MKRVLKFIAIITSLLIIVSIYSFFENNNAVMASEETQSSYKIEYYYDQDSGIPSYLETYGIPGEETELLTIEKLGFYKEGYIFEGWRLYRSSDNKWFLRDSEGKNAWHELDGGELPDGYWYALRKDGGKLISPTKSGIVKLIGQWGGIDFEVHYYLDEESEPSEMITTVTYGEATPLKSIEELGFSKEGLEFKGWKLYREIDGKWRVKNEDGKGSWGLLENGEPKEGYQFSIFKDGQEIIKAATSGIVRVYAQWGE